LSGIPGALDDSAGYEPGCRGERPANRGPLGVGPTTLPVAGGFNRADVGASPPPTQDVPVAPRAARLPRS
jgi:hypothetical protein